MLITFLRRAPYVDCRAASCATDSVCIKAEQKAKADDSAKRLAGVIDGMKVCGLPTVMVEELNSVGMRAYVARRRMVAGTASAAYGAACINRPAPIAKDG